MKKIELETAEKFFNELDKNTIKDLFNHYSKKTVKYLRACQKETETLNKSEMIANYKNETIGSYKKIYADIIMFCIDIIEFGGSINKYINSVYAYALTCKQHIEKYK